MSDRYPLEPDPRTMRRSLEMVGRRVIEHVASLPDQAASYDTARARDVARALVEELPEVGAPLDVLLEIVFDRATPRSFNTASPGYLAYIPGGGLFDSAVGDLIACAINRYSGVWLAAPGLVQLESNVVRWFCEIVGYPRAAGGLLTSGGSLANLIALITARRERLPADFLRGTLYVSDQTHHSVLRAALLAGFPAENVRRVPCDGRFRVDVTALAGAIRRDRDAGLEPFWINGNGGTTNTGAVDDLGALATLAEVERMWLHVDAAYGGFFALTARGRAALAGLERADSLTLDPHKGLFLPYGTGCLLVRDAETLRRAHATFADYMPALQEDRELVDFCQISPELSRDYRGLRVWLPLRLHGVRAFRDALDEKLDLARFATDALREIPDVTIVAEPQLSLVAFRLERPHWSDDVADERNRAWLAGVNARRRVYLTGTRVGGRFTLRICVLSFRTHRERVEACLEDLRGALGELAPVP